jgi:cation:H+ antiporter
MGTWLVGLATSLPEFVSSLAAVRMGAVDLAVGSLFGSNAFNMVIFLALDAAQEGSLFSVLDPRHALSALFAILLMSVGLAAIMFRAKRRVAMVEPDSFLIIVTYVLAVWALYQSGNTP